MNNSHHLIAVPGLSGNSFLFNKIVHSWRNFDFIPHAHDIEWKDDKNSFQPKLQRLVKRIDELSKDGRIISLIGTSAGGSMVLNAFSRRKDKIYKVVNICGRLREGENVSPTLEVAAKNSKSFYESVKLCEANTKAFLEKDLHKILTVRAMFDEIVPPSTTTLSGAKNIKIFSVEHSLSIGAAMTVYFHSISEFLKKP